MSRIKYPMSFFIWIFPWKCQKKIDTQMSEIKHLISILYEFFHENVKKGLDTQMSWIKPPMSFSSKFFHGNVKKKSSILKYQELSIRWNFIWISWKCQKKLDIQMSEIKHPMSFLYGFCHENVKKARYPNVMNQASDIIFYLDFSMKMSKKVRCPNVKN